MAAYYNEIDPVAAEVLRTLIANNVIAPGVVDTRSITEIKPHDLDGFTQCHFFAGAGLWSVAARLAGWPDDKPLWSGSCPCQPFSVAGKGAGFNDTRHLWPDFFRLISARRPPVVVGEQVAGQAGYGWLDRVLFDLADEDFAARGVDLTALAVDAPHIRQRLYWLAVADATGAGRLSASHGGICGEAQSERSRHAEPERHTELHRSAVADADRGRRTGRTSLAVRIAQRRAAAERHHESGRYAEGVTQGDAFSEGLEGQHRHGDSRDGRQGSARSVAATDGRNGSYWSDAEWIICHDGKARRTKPGLRLLVDGLVGRTDLWRLAGNSIISQLAAEVLKAYLETENVG